MSIPKRVRLGPGEHRALQGTDRLLRSHGRHRDADWLRRQLSQPLETPTIVVVGEVNRGKSSLVNALVLSDPGHPEGDMMEVPLEVLDDAWADSGYTAVVCDQPPGQGAATVDPVVADTRLDDSGEVAPDIAVDALSPRQPEEVGQVERVTSWVVQHPFVVLPIALGAAHLVARRVGDRAR